MIPLHFISLTILSLILIAFIVYVSIYILLSGRVKALEKELLSLFIKKTSKIPALIEVMRPYVAKKESFDSIIRVHTEVMIQEFQSVYDILTHNARIQNDFLFLMQLSVHIPSLQKDEYFLYIRDFIIDYEKRMKWDFTRIQSAIEKWNWFIKIKNMTLVWYLLPGSLKQELK